MFHTAPVKMSRMATKLDTQLVRWDQRHHGQHHAGQEAQHRDRLKNVEDRDHQRFHPRMIRSEVSVADREEQAQDVGDSDAHDRNRTRKAAELWRIEK